MSVIFPFAGASQPTTFSFQIKFTPSALIACSIDWEISRSRNESSESRPSMRCTSTPGRQKWRHIQRRLPPRRRRRVFSEVCRSRESRPSHARADARMGTPGDAPAMIRWRQEFSGAQQRIKGVARYWDRQNWPRHETYRPSSAQLSSLRFRSWATTCSLWRMKSSTVRVDSSERRSPPTRLRDAEDPMRHKEHVVAHDRKRREEQLRTYKIETFHGVASFVDPNTVRIAPDTLLRGEKILIATGSSPVRPQEFPFEHPRVHDSDEILEIGTLPKTLAVVGAGVIGAEYACTFAALGVEVISLTGATRCSHSSIAKSPSRSNKQ